MKEKQKTFEDYEEFKLLIKEMVVKIKC